MNEDICSVIQCNSTFLNIIIIIYFYNHYHIMFPSLYCILPLKIEGEKPLSITIHSDQDIVLDSGCPKLLFH